MDEKKSFVKGAVLGILSVLIIVGVLAGGGYYYGILQVNLDGTASGTGNLPVESSLVNKINSVQKILERNFLEEYDEQQLEDGMFAGMLAALQDPYTVYYTKEAYDSLMESSEGLYYGIGVVVQQDLQTGEIIVNYPYENSPGAEAGFLPGDIIYSVGDALASDYTIDEVVAMIRGEEGTWIEVGVLRDGNAEPIILKVQRRKIEARTVEHEMLEGKVGYVQVTQFDEVTPNQFQTALDDLMEQGMESVIVDLRDNPGGSLNAVMKMMDMMLPKGLYTYLEDKNGKKENYFGTEDARYDCPMAVLVNGNSASASELFTGAMHDYKRATIIGTTTFGKGIVQQIYPLSDGSGIKVTMAKYYTPNGVCIHKTGITPDIVIELDEGEYASQVSHEEDNQLQKALEILGK